MQEKYRHHEHHEHHEHYKISRRELIQGGIILLGLVSIPVISSIISVSEREIRNLRAVSTMPRLIIEVPRRQLHKPKEHYTHLKVYRNRMIFEKACCIRYEPVAVAVNGRSVGFVMKSQDPLVLEFPRYSGQVTVALRAQGSAEGPVYHFTV